MIRNSSVKVASLTVVALALTISTAASEKPETPTKLQSACDLAAGTANRISCLEPAQEPNWYPSGGGAGRPMLAYTIRI